MRIGLITGEYPPMQGGVGDYTQLLAHALTDLGHEVCVLTNLQGKQHQDAVQVSAWIKNWNRACFFTIPRWIQHKHLDVVNLQYQTAAYNMAGAIHYLPLRCRQTPFVTTFHDLRFPYLFPKAGFMRDRVVRHLAHLSTGSIVTNRQDEQQLIGIAPRLARIPIGANVGFVPPQPDGRAAIRAKLGVDEQTLVVAHFGFINASKGVDTLIRAAHLAQHANLKMRLMMIGGRTGASDPTNRTYVAGIDQLAAELKVEPVWTGYLEDDQIGDYFAAADVVALPFKDGASLRRGSLMGALAHGAAIVTTHPQADHLTEFQDGQDLLYVPLDDAQALADTLIKLAHHPEQRRQLQQAASQAAQQFRWDRIAERTVQFYAEVLSNKSS